MNPRKLLLPAQHSPIRWFYFAVCVLQLLLIGAEVEGQTKLTPVRTAYSALSAGIGTLWLTQEDGYFRKHGLDSNLIYIRGGSTAVQALLAGEIQFGHLSPAPMMTAWVQGADFVWVGTTTHQMVFTLLVDTSIAKGADLKGKKIGITRLGSASELAVRMALEQFAFNPKDVTMIALGGIPEILGAMRAGAVQCRRALAANIHRSPRFGLSSPACIYRTWDENLPFPASRQNAPSCKANPKSCAPTWPRSPTARKFIWKTRAPRCESCENTCAPTIAPSKAVTKNTTAAISSPPYPGLKGLEAVRDSLLETTPQLKECRFEKIRRRPFRQSQISEILCYAEPSLTVEL